MNKRWAAWLVAAACAAQAHAGQGTGSDASAEDWVSLVPAAAGVSPVDVLHPEDLMAVGYTTLPEILAELVPGFVFPRPALAGGTDHARPASFRGLAPDQMLVLLNGKRRHSGAWLHRGDTFGRGSASVDLSVIPLDSVKRVEIMRDGATARYGSGAIAGVVNVVLKDQTEGGSLSATFGQYRSHFDGVPDLSEFAPVSPTDFYLFERGDVNTDDGDGDTLTLSGHGGFTLFDAGYLDLGFTYRDQEPTDRSGFDPRRIYPDLAGGAWDPREQFVDRRTHRFGNPEQEDLNLLANFGMPVTRSTDFYGFIGYSARNAESAGEFHRARDADNLEAVHPDGYLPLLRSDAEDRYFTFGFRGVRWGWSWDLGYTQGENETDWEVADSLNASLGAISPTTFEVGNYEGRQVILALDLTRSFDLGLAGPVGVSWGLEARDEEYENEFGDRASYLAGGARDESGQLRPPGSQGLYGVRTVDDFDDNVATLAAYAQVEAVMSTAVSTLIAVRVEHQDRGTDVAAKSGLRWRVNDRLSVHGTLSRDFRSPSAAQTHFLRTELQAAGDEYRVRGTYPGYHPVAQALGATQLDSETTVSLAAGLSYQVSDALALELGAYRIDIDDRIVLSDYLSGAAVEAALQAGGGLADVAEARYFFNGLDTRTRGVDAGASYRWDSRWGAVTFATGLNVSDTQVTGSAGLPAPLAGAPSLQRLAPRQQAQLEAWTPDSKLHLSAAWQGQRLGLQARLVRYGEVTDFGDTAAEDLKLDPRWVLNVDSRYRLTPQTFLGIGVHNMLDAYSPGRPRGAEDPLENRFLPYSNYAPFGFNGRFVYLRLGLQVGG